MFFVGGDVKECNELDEYLSLSVEKVKDPLKWWYANRKAYPQLSCMALNYLSVPGMVCGLKVRGSTNDEFLI